MSAGQTPAESFGGSQYRFLLLRVIGLKLYGENVGGRCRWQTQRPYIVTAGKDRLRGWPMAGPFFVCARLPTEQLSRTVSHVGRGRQLRNKCPPAIALLIPSVTKP